MMYPMKIDLELYYQTNSLKITHFIKKRAPNQSMRQAMREVMQVKRLSESAILPTRGTSFAAGFDLASAIQTIIPAKGKALVKTDLSIAIPEGCYGRIAPRSGLAFKHHIDVGAGVIDADYRGNLGVLLFNHSDLDFVVNPGDRIAQLILEKISYADIEEVAELSETQRGEGGFGSTGINSTPQTPSKRKIDDETP